MNSKKLVIAIMLVIVNSTSLAQAKSANECESEITQDVNIETKRAMIMDCLLGNPPGTTKPVKIKTLRSPFRGEKLACEAIKGATCSESPDQSGTINGVAFRQYDDGSAWIDATAPGAYTKLRQEPRWHLGCERDAMSKKITCSINLDDLWVFLLPNGKILVSVGNDHFPGSTTSIRIGNQRFDTNHTDGNFPQSGVIAKTLKDGKQLVTRYMKWPYRTWIDVERDLYGAEAAMTLLIWSAKNLE